MLSPPLFTHTAIHVNTGNDPLTLVNPKDPVSGYSGIPRNMSGIAEKLAKAGYATGQSGKWHLGLATPDHTPKGRGYQQSLTYLDGANDYFTSQTGDFCDPALYVDLYSSDAPAYGLNNSLACSQTNQKGCTYEDALFVNFTLDVIASHDPSTPLFYYLALHNVHEPLEAPTENLTNFEYIYENCSAALKIFTSAKNSSCAAAVASPDEYMGADKQCCL
jgi:arylsulfatase B